MICPFTPIHAGASGFSPGSCQTARRASRIARGLDLLTTTMRGRADEVRRMSPSPLHTAQAGQNLRQALSPYIPRDRVPILTASVLPLHPTHAATGL